MPEISEVPANKKIVELHPPGQKLQRLFHNPNPDKPYSYKDIRKRIELAVRQTAQSLPTVSEQRVREVIFPAFFGPLLLEQQTLTSTTEDIGQKEMSARIQHSLVHSLFFATTDKASPAYLINQYDFARKMQLLCESDFGIKYNLSKFWDGVRNQLAVTHALADNGYRVILPDYAKLKDATKPEENQISKWDIKNGVDCVAFSNNADALLIDVGGMKKSTQGVFQYKLTPDSVNGLPMSLRLALNSWGAKNIFRASIAVLSSDFLSNHLPSLPKDTYRDSLRRYSCLKDSTAQNIMDKLNSGLKTSQLPMAA